MTINYCWLSSSEELLKTKKNFNFPLTNFYQTSCGERENLCKCLQIYLKRPLATYQTLVSISIEIFVSKLIELFRKLFLSPLLDDIQIHHPIILFPILFMFCVLIDLFSGYVIFFHPTFYI